jgi:carboxylate-amine ligase
MSKKTAPQEEVPTPALGVFQAYGIELEYMIVEARSLDVRPLAPALLRGAAELARGEMGWSNELNQHQLEIKNPLPRPRLDILAPAFQQEVAAVNAMLAPLSARLMPGGMHPWMNPARESCLWEGELYRAYDRLFDCRRHGWANIQSMHVNLPFSDDQEFAQLHAAVRLVLPILPALAASSPYAEGRGTGYADYRLKAYADHQARLPASMGKLIPEPSASPAAYREQVLAPMYEELAPHDEAGLLHHEWFNARAAIPRFERNAIEIRVLDTQECPQADLAIAAAAIALLRRLFDAGPAWLATEGSMETPALARILEACMRDAEQAAIEDPRYLSILGSPGHPCSARQLWARLLQELSAAGLLGPEWAAPLKLIIDQGPLARRLIEHLGPEPTRARLHEAYQELCLCLQEGRMFQPKA